METLHGISQIYQQLPGPILRVISSDRMTGIRQINQYHACYTKDP